MDHEVKDDVDVERAGREDAEAVRLEEHGLIEVGQEGLYGWIEALEVADLEDALRGRGQGDEFIGFFDSAGDGLLDQYVQTGIERGSGYCGVGAGGCADGCGVEGSCVIGEAGFKAGIEPWWLDVQGCGFGSQCLGLGWIGQKRVNDGSQMDGLPVLFQLLVDTNVVLAEGAGTDDGDLKS